MQFKCLNRIKVEFFYRNIVSYKTIFVRFLGCFSKTSLSSARTIVNMTFSHQLYWIHWYKNLTAFQIDIFYDLSSIEDTTANILLSIQGQQYKYKACKILQNVHVHVHVGFAVPSWKKEYLHPPLPSHLLELPYLILCYDSTIWCSC